MSSSKILVLNPSTTTLKKLLKKQNSLNSASGPFDFVLLLGDVLDIDKVPRELPAITAETFFTDGINFKAADGSPKQIQDSLNYLGGIGIHALANGLKIGFVSGDLTNVTPSQLDSVFNGQTLDILISYHWPSVLASELKLTLFGNSKIDTVVKLTKPRYHFACGSENGKYYERSPIFWKEELRVTRFISLSQYGSKEKFHYAFNLNLESSKDLENVSGSDTNPFLFNPKLTETVSLANHTKRPVDDEDSKTSDNERGSGKKRKPYVTPSQCFFCLSNPNIETHMIVSIGEKCYVTIAKGPLTRPRRDLIRFSGHGIIIPVSHLPNLASALIQEDVTSLKDTAIVKEIVAYQEAIVQMFKSINEDYNVVFFEISREKSIHYHIQFVPVLSKYAEKFDNALNKALRNNENFPRNYKFIFKKVASEELSKIQESSDYMLISVWDTPISRTNYVSELQNAEGLSVDLQFPRRVLANVLNEHKRVYWDKCKQSKEKETEDCENFKEAFKSFDFSLQ